MTQFQALARPMALAAIVTCVFAYGLASWPSAGEAAKAKSASQATQGPKAGQSGGGDSDAEQKAVAIAAAKRLTMPGSRNMPLTVTKMRSAS